MRKGAEGGWRSLRIWIESLRGLEGAAAEKIRGGIIERAVYVNYGVIKHALPARDTGGIIVYSQMKAILQ